MPTKKQAAIYQPTPRNLARLARVLQEGGLVAVPTETVYGLAADALNAGACRRIFQAKGRPSTDPLIVHLGSPAQLERLAVTNAATERVAEAFWPGPLTVVLPKRDVVPDIVTSGRPSVAVRLPAHPVFRQLLEACGRPLAAPSANPFGYISPTTARHVREGLGSKISYILEGGPCEIGVESTIVDLRDPRRPVLLRPGAIEKSALEEVLGHRLLSRQRSGTARGMIAPGMLSKHYSPRTPLLLYSKLKPQAIASSARTEAFLFFRRPGGISEPDTHRVFWLSSSGVHAEAARTLFAQLRQLDAGKWTRIHAELAPGKSALADAINDRLTRAAAKR